MPPAPERIKCPRNPSHGMATKRWLPPEEREMITEGEGDVFEIDCEFCGKTEYRDDRAVE
jgi:redox-regulated HSP33 family molecular chaperone